MGYTPQQPPQQPVGMESFYEPCNVQLTARARQPGAEKGYCQSNTYVDHLNSEMRNPLDYPGQRCTQQGTYQHQICQQKLPDLGYPAANSRYYDPQLVPSSSQSYMDLPPPGYDDVLHHQSRSLPGASGTSSLQGSTPACNGKLNKPIAIPATQATLGSPFLRAYPPVLLHFDIPRDIFLQFLDGLNRAAVASPPIQVLGLAGNIVSMVPLHTTQIVGGAVNAAARLGTVAVLKGRVEAHLREANREIFGPKGLKAEIAKLDALAAVAKMPILGPDGKIDKNLPLLRDFEDGEDTLTLPAQHRRVLALERWVERLEVLGLPAAERASNPISRMHASASERQRRKEEEKLGKERMKGQKEWQKESKKLEQEYNKKMRELERDEKKARRKGDDDKLDRIEEKRERIQEKFGTRMEKGGNAGNKGEEKLLRKICFLMITNV